MNLSFQPGQVYGRMSAPGESAEAKSVARWQWIWGRLVPGQGQINYKIVFTLFVYISLQQISSRKSSPKNLIYLKIFTKISKLSENPHKSILMSKTTNYCTYALKNTMNQLVMLVMCKFFNLYAFV